jgi:uncharacterized protein
MPIDCERRITEIKFDLRADTGGSDKPKVIGGIAASYNTLSQLLPSRDGRTAFRERILPGAFKNCINQDVVCLQDHDPSKVLGRTKSGTLALRETDKGLGFVCFLPNTQTANDLHESVKRGDVNSCSFAFDLDEKRDCSYDEMDEDDVDPRLDKRGKVLVRTIRNFARLHDVSVVTFPAYSNGTSVSARSAALALPVVLTPSQEQIEAEIRRNTPSDPARARRTNLLNTIL